MFDLIILEISPKKLILHGQIDGIEKGPLTDVLINSTIEQKFSKTGESGGLYKHIHIRMVASSMSSTSKATGFFLHSLWTLWIFLGMNYKFTRNNILNINSSIPLLVNIRDVCPIKSFTVLL